jgi:hypothetical protein
MDPFRRQCPNGSAWPFCAAVDSGARIGRHVVFGTALDHSGGLQAEVALKYAARSIYNAGMLIVDD